MLKEDALESGFSGHASQYFFRSTLLLAGYWLLWHAAGFFEVAPFVSAFYPAPGFAISFICIYGPRYLPVLALAISVGALPEVPFSNYTMENLWQIVRQVGVYGGVGWIVNRYDLFGFKGRDLESTSILIATLIGSAFISALIARQIFVTFETFPQEMLTDVFFSFWAGDSAGVIMTAPFIASIMHKATSTNNCSDQVTAGPSTLIKFALVPSLASSMICFQVAQFETLSPLIFGFFLIVALCAVYGGYWAAMVSVISVNVTVASTYVAMGETAYPALHFQIMFAASAIVGLLVGSASDDRRDAVSSLIRREREAARMTRIASVGEIAASINHQIASPLQAALLRLDLAIKSLRRGDNPEDIQSSVEDAQAAIRRIASVQNSMRQFLTDGKREFKPVDINASIKAALKLTERYAADEGVSINCKLQAGQPHILGGDIEFQQVVINIVNNAVEAMRGQRGADKGIEISTGLVGVEDVEIVFSDTGPGINAESLDKLFDPYFTLKPDGNGLGLSISNTIIESFGGSISASLKETGGLHIVVRIPAQKMKPDANG